jgi:hypothetical protein
MDYAYTYMYTGHIHTLSGDLPTGLKHWKAALKHDPTLGGLHTTSSTDTYMHAHTHRYMNAYIYA